MRAIQSAISRAKMSILFIFLVRKGPSASCPRAAAGIQPSDTHTLDSQESFYLVSLVHLVNMSPSMPFCYCHDDRQLHKKTLCELQKHRRLAVKERGCECATFGLINQIQSACAWYIFSLLQSNKRDSSCNDTGCGQNGFAWGLFFSRRFLIWQPKNG